MKKVNNLILLCLMIIIASCQDDFLEVKPDKALLVPKTLKDFQSLLDNINVMNRVPSLPILACDEYSIIDNGLNKVSNDFERNTYLYRNEPLKGVNDIGDWMFPYRQIFYANVVLEGLKGMNGSGVGLANYQRVKGSALFFRSFAFFNLTAVYCGAYDAATASISPGIFLRLGSDINEMPKRSSLDDAYVRILSDLNDAYELLPSKSSSLNRPSKHAAAALMARVYLFMGNYDMAEKWAEIGLAFSDKLIDYNTISPGASVPFPEPLPNNNKELIFYVTKVAYSFYGAGILRIENSLLTSFSPEDLRPGIFFFKTGSGSVNNKNYDGIATDELYLIKAECYARSRRISEAMGVLNTLLIKRYRKGMFNNYHANNETDALAIIFAERRKELFARGLRWGDLKRLNKDPRFAKDLQRIYNGIVYNLPANDDRYIFSIPDNEL